MIKNLKSLFIVESDEDTPKEIKKKLDTPSNTLTEKKDTSLPTVGSASVDNKILEKLLKVIENNNLEGFDYFEFKSALKNMEKMNFDEVSKYKSAFATLTAVGLDTTKLVDSANHYISVLDKEKKSFEKASKEQFRIKIVENQNKIKQYTTLIEKHQKEIERINAEVLNSQKEIKKIEETITQSHTKIETTKVQFESTLEFLKQQIESDISKIQEYLK